MTSKFIISKELERTNFFGKKEKIVVSYESVKSRVRHSCNNTECKKYGFLSDTNKPRIERGDFYLKLSLKDSYNTIVQGYFCCEDCLKVGMFELQKKLIEGQKDRDDIASKYGKEMVRLSDLDKKNNPEKYAWLKAFSEMAQLDLERLKNLREEVSNGN